MKKVLLLLITAVLATGAVFATATSETDSTGPLTWVWYPNESTPEFADARSAIIDVVEQTLGREVEEQLTTDYAIAIEALVNENAAFSWFGGEGYVQAHAKDPAILPLVTNSGSSGTLSDAKYYSMLGTLVENADQYKVGGEFDLDTLEQKKFSFVSNSSTSGFRVPSSIIRSNFGVEAEDLLEGGDDKIFAEVMFGGSHQGSFFNVLTGRADIGAFCNACVGEYVEWVNGSSDDPVAGDIIRVKEGADSPFDQVPGVEVVFVATVPVLNAPIVMNTNLLTDEEVAALRTAFTSDEVAANTAIFAPRDSDIVSFFRAGQRFVEVDDAWYNPIRALAQ